MMSKNQANPYPLRLPADMMEKLKFIASENSRSVNGEIMHLAKNLISEYEAKYGEIKIAEEE